MNEITAEQVHLFVHNVFLGILKNESRTTRSILAAVPNVTLEYRPDPCAKTANELLRHIASADNFFLKSVVDGAFVPGSVKSPEDVKTPEETVEWYGREYAKNFDAVANLSGEQLIKMVDFRGLFARPAYTFLQFGLLHTVHHRGQLSTYLRPMGGKVPGNLRRKLRFRRSEKSCASSGLTCLAKPNLSGCGQNTFSCRFPEARISRNGDGTSLVVFNPGPKFGSRKYIAH